MSILYIVATPIGNLKDITYRAVETLKNADVIACEDTRVTKKLLLTYSIQDKYLISCNAVNEEKSKHGIIKLLDSGKNIALVTDAGTPCISDPGARIVDSVQKTSHTIIPIPGPSAAVCAASCAGNIGKSYLFEGFLPKKENKIKKRLEQLLSMNITFVLYESVYRIIKIVESISIIEPKRKIMVARELTKIYEEKIIGEAENIAQELKKRQNLKGEFCVVVYYNNNC